MLRFGVVLFEVTLNLLVSADLNFVALGDWGGHSDAEPTTPAQDLTALGLQAVARETSASFALLLGDNFYDKGILTDVTSTRFNSTFENVYSGALPHLPFYAIAGNHDYQANVLAQLEYSKVSNQWHFPALWYKKEFRFNVGGETRSLDLILLDTCGLRGESQYETAEKQWSWLSLSLAKSEADFLWVVGHHPVRSGGAHGSDILLIEKLDPMLRKYGAHYLSGHDHNLFHISEQGVHSFIVGTGKECCYRPLSRKRDNVGTVHFMVAGEQGRESEPPVSFPILGGFASFRFDADSAWIRLHAHDGQILYNAPPIPRREKEVSTMPPPTAAPAQTSAPSARTTFPYTTHSDKKAKDWSTGIYETTTQQILPSWVGKTAQRDQPRTTLRPARSGSTKPEPEPEPEAHHQVEPQTTTQQRPAGRLSGSQEQPSGRLPVFAELSLGTSSELEARMLVQPSAVSSVLAALRRALSLDVNDAVSLQSRGTVVAPGHLHAARRWQTKLTLSLKLVGLVHSQMVTKRVRQLSTDGSIIAERFRAAYHEELSKRSVIVAFVLMGCAVIDSKSATNSADSAYGQSGGLPTVVTSASSEAIADRDAAQAPDSSNVTGPLLVAACAGILILCCITLCAIYIQRLYRFNVKIALEGAVAEGQTNKRESRSDLAEAKSQKHSKGQPSSDRCHRPSSQHAPIRIPRSSCSSSLSSASLGANGLRPLAPPRIPKDLNKAHPHAKSGKIGDGIYPSLNKASIRTAWTSELAPPGSTRDAHKNDSCTKPHKIAWEQDGADARTATPESVDSQSTDTYTET